VNLKAAGPKAGTNHPQELAGTGIRGS